MRLSTPILSLIKKKNLSCSLFLEFLRGMQSDLCLETYHTCDSLLIYSWRVAGTVGRIALEILKIDSSEAILFAENLALSLQLTNILRDLQEDLLKKRCYLPLEDLERFEVERKELLPSLSLPKLTHLFFYEGERILSFWAKTERAWQELSPREKRALFPARLMQLLYQELFFKLKRKGFPLLEEKMTLSLKEKLLLFIRALLFS